MNIGIFSDLHLKHWKSHGVAHKDLIDWVLKETKDCDIVINAGDSELSLKPVFRMERPAVHYVEVMGNHDYYDMPAGEILSPDAMGSLTIEGVKITWAPLWTKLDHPLDDVRFFSFTDSKWITGFMPHIQREAFNRHFDFLSKSEADIIVTHHAPFTMSVHEDYEFDDFNNFFCAKIDYEIYQFKKMPKLWVHGHTHHSFDYDFSGIRVVCNPFGYYFEPNHKNYKIRKIEI